MSSEGLKSAHLAHKAHFAPALKLQSFKLEENNKKREYIKENSIHTETALRFVREVRGASDIPVIAAAIRESGSDALDLETYGQRKSDGLDPWAGDIWLLSLCTRRGALDFGSANYRIRLV